MFKKYYLLLFCFSFCISFSQNIIKGEVKDENNQSIVSASIILKDNYGKIITYTHSDEFGKYVLRIEKSGQLVLIASSMGFEQKSFDFSIENKSEIKTIDFVLTSKEIELEEIIIESTRPITIKKDTIIFNAESFLQGNEEVVEDLLKKIPGINVSSNGTIRVGNQEVEKIMINNDDMFEKGYKILAKNMPVNPIDKVELLQNYSNNKHLKGIENSNKVALNLTLKEDYQRQWFGNLQLGYGLSSKNRHESRGNLMNFGNKSKYYFLTNLNNVGYDAVGDITNLIKPNSTDDIASVGDEESSYVLLSDNESYVPKLKSEQVNFNNAKMLSLNSIFTLSEKIKIKLLGFFNKDENDFFRNSFQSFSVGNISFENTEDFTGRKKQFTGFGKVDFTYEVSQNKTLEYTAKFNKSDIKNNNNLLFNGVLSNGVLQSDNQLIDQKIVFTNKFRENKVLLLTGRYIDEKRPQNYTVNQFVFSDLFSENANNTAQFSENKMQFAGVEAQLLDKKKNGNLLELRFGNQLRIDELNTRFKLLENKNLLAFPNDYQNNLTYTTNDLYVSGKYRFKVKNFTLLAQSDFHQLFNQLKNVNVKIHQNPFFIIPKIGLDWQINDKNKILTTYSYNTTNARVLDVFSGFVHTGFRSFSKGLEEFNQLTASSAILNYTYGSWGDKFFANTFILYTKNNDFFSSNSIIAQNYSQSQQIIIKDREFLTISSNIDRYFKPLKSNFKINLGVTKTNFKNIVNNSNLREVKNINIDYGFELRSGFRGFFNYHFGSKWSYNQITTTLSNSFTDNMTFVDLSFKINDKFNVKIQAEKYYFGSLDKNNNNYYFMDLDAKHVIIHNKLTLSLSGNNLFNTKTFRSYSITDISISKTEYRLLPRYFLFKAEYRF